MLRRSSAAREPRVEIHSHSNVVYICGGQDMGLNRQSVTHIDALHIADYLVKKFERTSEGFLKGRAVVTSVGVFTYRNKDGTEHTELRLPEEVFAYDSLESLKLKPLTLLHPAQLITSQNVKDHIIGVVGDNPSKTSQMRDYDTWNKPDDLTDGFHLSIDLVVHDEDSIQQVVEGKMRALSCGYTCDLEEAESNARWCGVAYDFIQRNIRYNHVAIVPAARAGDAAVIKLDGADVESVLVNRKKLKQEGTKMLKKVKLDGITYEAEETVIKSLSEAVTKVDELTSDVSKLEGERDAAIARADAAEAKAKAVEETSPQKLDELVNARVQLRETAKLAEVEVKDGMTDEEIKKAVIVKLQPKATLDGKDGVYIQARFDAAVEGLATKADASNRSAGKGGEIPAEGEEHRDGADEPASVKARNKYIARLNGDSDDTK